MYRGKFSLTPNFSYLQRQKARLICLIHIHFQSYLCEITQNKSFHLGGKSYMLVNYCKVNRQYCCLIIYVVRNGRQY